tara:strand:+ start:39 stop:710 length:672 start_codon:yes stop_codon:yes gene_type:complete
MKKITTMIHSRLAKLATIAAALAAFTGPVHAQEALKIAIMDIEKVRASYWKTQMSMKQVAERDADFKKVEQGMLDDLRQIVEDFNRFAQSAQDPANSEAKRQADAKQARGKEADHRQAKARHTEYLQGAQRTMRDMTARLSRARLEEIREVASFKAKQAGYDIVFNASENSLGVVVYSSGKNDLTDEIITELNKDAPEEFKPKKPAAADGPPPAATAPAPAEK